VDSLLVFDGIRKFFHDHSPFLFVVASSVSEGSFLCVSPVKWIYYAASFLISPSNTAVMTDPTAHARMYNSG
jgi:hypothetical protein